MKRAFTLIEILVVTGILALLAAALIPVVSQAKRHAKEPVDISNMRQIYMALMMYEDEHAGADPADLMPLRPLVRADALFVSPMDVRDIPMADGKWPAETFVWCSPHGPIKISYAYLKTFAPYDDDLQPKWRAARDNPSNGILASTWAGSPMYRPNTAMPPCGDLLVNAMGPPMDGPILRICMDGSLYRLRQNLNTGWLGNPADMFFNR